MRVDINKTIAMRVANRWFGDAGATYLRPNFARSSAEKAVKLISYLENAIDLGLEGAADRFTHLVRMYACDLRDVNTGRKQTLAGTLVGLADQILALKSVSGAVYDTDIKGLAIPIPEWRHETIVTNESGAGTLVSVKIGQCELVIQHPGQASPYLRPVEGSTFCRNQLFFHPHALPSGRVCWGEAEGVLHNLLTAGALLDAYYTALWTLTHYNRRSPHAKITEWLGDGYCFCGLCGCGMLQDAAGTCPNFKCLSHGVPICPNCLKSDGSAKGCLSCMVPCKLCHSAYVRYPQPLCSACHEARTTRPSDPVS